MFTALGDPYSQYLTSQEYKDSLRGISGEFEGSAPRSPPARPTARPGCTPLGPGGALVISSPLDGSPAKKAGIKAGDVVIAVDGKSLDGLTVDEART